MIEHNDIDPLHEPKLLPDDARLLDVLIEAGYDRAAVGPLSAAQQLRMQALSGALGLLKDYPVEDAEETLVFATLARIDRHEDEASARLRFDDKLERSAAGARGRRFRIPDFITVAAVVLIGVSVAWPLIATIRNHSIDEACANNLKYMGYAFSNYAADNGGGLPIIKAGMPWDVLPNALNLQPLIEGHYCESGHLECPGHHDHEHAGPSYSYRWFPAKARVGWGTTQRPMVVLGDLNPVIDPARSGIFVPPLSMSINHAGRGQNVLVSDNSVMWLEQPVVGANDNIWLPNGRQRLEIGEEPSDIGDVFLAH